MIVGAGVAGPQHHEEEADRHGDLKHRLQEHSLTQPHKGCCWLLQERHTAWGKRKAKVLGKGEQSVQALVGGLGLLSTVEQTAHCTEKLQSKRRY